MPVSGDAIRHPRGAAKPESALGKAWVRRVISSITIHPGFLQPEPPDIHDESIGYRPGKGARQGSYELRETLQGGEYRWVVEADIRSFFDHVDHDWLVKMLEERIADRPLIRLIVKWLKAGVMEENQVAYLRITKIS